MIEEKEIERESHTGKTCRHCVKLREILALRPQLFRYIDVYKKTWAANMNYCPECGSKLNG